MCMLIAKKSGIELPEEKYLHNSFSKNSHGTGIAWQKPNASKVQISKGFKDFDSFYKFLTENVTANDALIIHFRFATAGLKDAGNCHPFPLTGNLKLMRKVSLSCNTAIAHNGVFSEYSGNKKYSDTQKFIAQLMKPVFSRLGDKSIRRVFSRALNGNKLAVLTNHVITLYGSFETEKGVFYSNDGYKRKVYEYQDGNLSGVYSGGNDNDSWSDYFSKRETSRTIATITPEPEPETEHKPYNTDVNDRFFIDKVGKCDWCQTLTSLFWHEPQKSYLCDRCLEKVI